MKTYKVQTITTKTELKTVQAESEADAILKTENSPSENNQLQITRTAQKLEEISE